MYKLRQTKRNSGRFLCGRRSISSLSGSFQVNAAVLMKHMRAFSEEGLWSVLHQTPDQKTFSSAVWERLMSPLTPIKIPHCQLKLPSIPPTPSPPSLPPSLCPAWHRAHTGLPQTDSGTAFQVPTHPVAGKLSRACQLAVCSPSQYPLRRTQTSGNLRKLRNVFVRPGQPIFSGRLLKVA